MTTQLLFASYKLECVPNKGVHHSPTSMAGDVRIHRCLLQPAAQLGYLTPANTLLVYLNHFSTKWGTVHVVPSVSSWARNGRTSSTTPSSSCSQEYAIVF